jgi:hypothetical protein
MPTPPDLLRVLAAIANDGVVFAAAWHLVLLIATLALVLGWRPTVQRALAASALLPASVAAFALGYGNVFNGVVFTVLALLIVVLATREVAEPVRRASPFAAIGGIALVAFGVFYPHFLPHPSMYAYAAPVGLIPCPTLSLLAGIALLLSDQLSRRVRILIAAIAGFYGVFGVARLDVMIDLGLFAGAALLAATLSSAHWRSSSPPPLTTAV